MLGIEAREKPPIGLVPKHIHDWMRAIAIKEAIERYQEAGIPIQKEWLQEYYDITKNMIT